MLYSHQLLTLTRASRWVTSIITMTLSWTCRPWARISTRLRHLRWWQIVIRLPFHWRLTLRLVVASVIRISISITHNNMAFQSHPQFRLLRVRAMAKMYRTRSPHPFLRSSNLPQTSPQHRSTIPHSNNPMLLALPAHPLVLVSLPLDPRVALSPQGHKGCLQLVSLGLSNQIRS
jgi:hypothetical protein